MDNFVDPGAGQQSVRGDARFTALRAWLRIGQLEEASKRLKQCDAGRWELHRRINRAFLGAAQVPVDEGPPGGGSFVLAGSCVGAGAGGAADWPVTESSETYCPTEVRRVGSARFAECRNAVPLAGCGARR